jgi:hypothetical protein
MRIKDPDQQAQIVGCCIIRCASWDGRLEDLALDVDTPAKFGS